MRKQDCEYCADEKDCKSKKHNMDCIFCECQSGYDTNFTCRHCEHDMARCTCPSELIQQDIDALLKEFGLHV